MWSRPGTAGSSRCRRPRSVTLSAGRSWTSCSTWRPSGSSKSGRSRNGPPAPSVRDAITISWDVVLLRLVVAALLGAAIGLERELREHEAGLRTHILVCVGSALVTLVSAYGFNECVRQGQTVAPTRIAAQIVTGMACIR